MTTSGPDTSSEMLKGLEEFIREAASHSSDPRPIKPSQRVPFHWPPHPVSKDFHVLASDWTGHASFEAYGEEFDVEVVRTAQGVH